MGADNTVNIISIQSDLVEKSSSKPTFTVIVVDD
jgi:hypothetical protein